MKNWIPHFKIDPETGKPVHGPHPEVPGMLLDDEANADWERKMAFANRYAGDPMNPELTAHWAQCGMRKELFEYDAADDRYAWSLFTPLSIKSGKKYAMIYLSHGGGQNIHIAETYGLVELAAAEHFFVCFANNGGESNNEVDTEFPRVLGEIRAKGYPVDWERVYCVGFSSGSEASAAAACTNPRLCAAVGILPGGQPFKDLLFYTGRDYYASLEGLRMPGCFLGGTMDPANYPAPFYKDLPPRPECAENLNIWLHEIAQVRSCPDITLPGLYAAMDSADPVLHEFGLVFDRTFALHVEGLDWIGGEFYGTDGAPVYRTARAIGCRHIVWDSQLNLVWDYLKHFRRDQTTGESIYDPLACWGEK